MSTTSLQFLATLAPYLKVKDLAALPAGDRNLVNLAINQSLDWWDSNAPSPLRNRPWTTTLKPPRTLSVTVTEDSQTITFNDDPEASAIGCTIIIADDVSQNRVQSLTQLKLPYIGSTGTKQATLYGDGAALPSGFVTFTDQIWYERSDSTRRVVTPYTNQIGWTGPIITAEPWYYQLEQGQTLDGLAPFTIIRFLHAAGLKCRISSQIEARAARWTLSDWTTSRTLDLQDAHWTMLHALIIERLLTKPNVLDINAMKDQINTLLLEAQATKEQIKHLTYPGTSAGHQATTPPNF